MNPSQAQFELHLDRLCEGLPGISPAVGAYLVEACAFSFHHHQHPEDVVLTIAGGHKRTYTVRWRPERITDQIIRSWQDYDEAREQGAVCLACLLIVELTEYTVIERSRKGTGFDYWLGKDDQTQLFSSKSGRMEVSGMGKGSDYKIKQRVKEKLAQSDPTDHLNLPAYAVVVQFTRPVAHVAPK